MNLEFWRKLLQKIKLSHVLSLLLFSQILFFTYSLGLFVASLIDFFSTKPPLVFPNYISAYKAPPNLEFQVQRYTNSILNNLFATQKAPPGLLNDPNSKEKGNLDRIVLNAIFVWTDKSLALLKNEDQSAVVELGKKIPNTEILLAEVRRDEVLVQNGQEERWIKIAKSGAENPQPLSNNNLKAEPVSYNPGNQGGITQMPILGNKQEIRLSQKRVELELKNFAEFLNQARVVPNFSNGLADGYSIGSIVPGSIFEQLGLKNKDVIRSINGNAIDSPEKALELFKLLRNEKMVQLAISRDGTPLNLVFHIH